MDGSTPKNRKTMAYLMIGSERYPVYEGINSVGRDRRATVPVKHLGVSQLHALIMIIDDDKHYISDCNSSNGTYVDYSKIEPLNLYQIDNESEIKFSLATSASYTKVPKGTSVVTQDSATLQNTQTDENFYSANTQLVNSNSSFATNRTQLNLIPNNRTTVHETDTKIFSVSKPKPKLPEKDTNKPSTSADLSYVIPDDDYDYDFALVSTEISEACTQKIELCDLASRKICSTDDEMTQPVDFHDLNTQFAAFPMPETKENQGQVTINEPTSLSEHSKASSSKLEITNFEASTSNNENRNFKESFTSNIGDGNFEEATDIQQNDNFEEATDIQQNDNFEEVTDNQQNDNFEEITDNQQKDNFEETTDNQQNDSFKEAQTSGSHIKKVCDNNFGGTNISSTTICEDTSGRDKPRKADASNNFEDAETSSLHSKNAEASPNNFENVKASCSNVNETSDQATQESVTDSECTQYVVKENINESTLVLARKFRKTVDENKSLTSPTNDLMDNNPDNISEKSDDFLDDARDYLPYFTPKTTFENNDSDQPKCNKTGNDVTEIDEESTHPATSGQLKASSENENSHINVEEHDTSIIEHSDVIGSDTDCEDQAISLRLPSDAPNLEVGVDKSNSNSEVGDVGTSLEREPASSNLNNNDDLFVDSDVESQLHTSQLKNRKRRCIPSDDSQSVKETENGNDVQIEISVVDSGSITDSEPLQLHRSQLKKKVYNRLLSEEKLSEVFFNERATTNESASEMADKLNIHDADTDVDMKENDESDCSAAETKVVKKKRSPMKTRKRTQLRMRHSSDSSNDTEDENSSRKIPPEGSDVEKASRKISFEEAAVDKTSKSPGVEKSSNNIASDIEETSTDTDAVLDSTNVQILKTNTVAESTLYPTTSSFTTNQDVNIDGASIDTKTSYDLNPTILKNNITTNGSDSDTDIEGNLKHNASHFSRLNSTSDMENSVVYQKRRSSLDLTTDVIPETQNFSPQPSTSKEGMANNIPSPQCSSGKLSSQGSFKLGLTQMMDSADASKIEEDLYIVQGLESKDEEAETTDFLAPTQKIVESNNEVEDSDGDSENFDISPKFKRSNYKPICDFDAPTQQIRMQSELQVETTVPVAFKQVSRAISPPVMELNDSELFIADTQRGESNSIFVQATQKVVPLADEDDDDAFIENDSLFLVATQKVESQAKISNRINLQTYGSKSNAHNIGKKRDQDQIGGDESNSAEGIEDDGSKTIKPTSSKGPLELNNSEFFIAATQKMPLSDEEYFERNDSIFEAATQKVTTQGLSDEDAGDTTDSILLAAPQKVDALNVSSTASNGKMISSKNKVCFGMVRQLNSDPESSSNDETIVKEGMVEVTDKTVKELPSAEIQEKTSNKNMGDDIESQLEVMFATQTLRLSPTDSDRPTNPMGNALDKTDTQDEIYTLATLEYAKDSSSTAKLGPKLDKDSEDSISKEPTSVNSVKSETLTVNLGSKTIKKLVSNSGSELDAVITSEDPTTVADVKLMYPTVATIEESTTSAGGKSKYAKNKTADESSKDVKSKFAETTTFEKSSEELAGNVRPRCTRQNSTDSDKVADGKSKYAKAKTTDESSKDVKSKFAETTTSEESSKEPASNVRPRRTRQNSTDSDKVIVTKTRSTRSVTKRTKLLSCVSESDEISTTNNDVEMVQTIPDVLVCEEKIVKQVATKISKLSMTKNIVSIDDESSKDSDYFGGADVLNTALDKTENQSEVEFVSSNKEQISEPTKSVEIRKGETKTGSSEVVNVKRLRSSRLNLGGTNKTESSTSSAKDKPSTSSVKDKPLTSLVDNLPSTSSMNVDYLCIPEKELQRTTRTRKENVVASSNSSVSSGELVADEEFKMNTRTKSKSIMPPKRTTRNLKLRTIEPDDCTIVEDKSIVQNVDFSNKPTKVEKCTEQSTSFVPERLSKRKGKATINSESSIIDATESASLKTTKTRKRANPEPMIIIDESPRKRTRTESHNSAQLTDDTNPAESLTNTLEESANITNLRAQKPKDTKKTNKRQRTVDSDDSDDGKIIITVPKKQINLKISDSEDNVDTMPNISSNPGRRGRKPVVKNVKNADTSVKPGGSRLETPTKKSRFQRTVSEVSTTSVLSTPERAKRKLKPKIVFTMLDSPELCSLVRSLGGTIVDSIDSATVLITKQVLRSQKLLCAIGQAKPICSPEWLKECKKANTFLDPWDHLIIDNEAENRWKFSLAESYNRSKNGKLFAGYHFQVIASSGVDVIKAAIESSGGKCVSKAPKDGTFVVIATEDNKKKCAKFLKQKTMVVLPEAIFDGVLRQEIDFNKHLLI